MQNGLERMFFMKEKKSFILKEKYLNFFKYFMKILGKISNFLADTLAKMSQNILNIFPYQNILHLTPILVTARGFASPPPVYGLVRNLFFLRLPIPGSGFLKQ